MTYHENQQLTPVLLPENLSELALRRYLPDDLATELLCGPPSLRTLLEAFVQLASARYTIGTYLPRHLVERQVTTSGDGPWLEWVDGSLLFADVSGSTALAERLTSLGREGIEIVTNTLNDFFDTMITVIQKNGGDLLTFGGDALLVLFTGEAHAHVAASAALDLLHALRGFERSVAGIGTFPLSLRIGVESGRVALLSAGQPEALRYSAMGSTVNSVARAETYGDKGELIVGPHTWACICADAEGDLLEDGYVRVRTLHKRPTTVAVPLDDDSINYPPEQAIPLLINQLDRICPYLPAGLRARILIDPQRPRLEADLRPVTVLFAQVLGLGGLIEVLEPEQAAHAIDVFLRLMQVAVERFGGVINKIDLADEGDKLLAIFGAPVAYEDHAERAALAALAMQDALLEFRLQLFDWMMQTKISHFKSDIQLRIGLNTGTVFAGNVGTAERKEYTVMGDAVNVAARVMSKASWGEVWCSAVTEAAIRVRLLCEDRDRVAVKGKNEPLHLWRVVGEQVQQREPEPDAVPLVGRQEELRWLREHLAVLSSGQGQVLRISGEAGVGKSRLTATLREEARALGMRVIQVNCLSYATITPYAPWGDWLKALCGIEPVDGQVVRAHKLGATLDLLGSAAREWLPVLADLVRLDTEETLLTRALDPQQRQTRRFELVTDLLCAAAHQAAPAGLLVLFEDLHWADQSSLDLWRYVAARIKAVPVVLLGVHRPQLSWHSAQDDAAHVLSLGELRPSDSEVLLAARLEGMNLPPAIRQQIVARAGGNPLFLEQMAHAVLNSAMDEESLAAALDELPDSLNGLLLARIDRLDENSRALLRVASVIGQRFPFGILQSIHPSDQRILLRQLSRLDEEAFTQMERETPERVHMFRHALIQEVAYQSLLYSRRRELHRRIGDYLERRYAADLAALKSRYTPSRAGYDLLRDRRDPDTPERMIQSSSGVLFLLAHHYRLSDDSEKAITYLLLAGHAAREAYANDEAIQSYRWALELLDEQPADPRSWEAREALGDVLCTIGDYAAALAEHAAILAADTSGVLPPAVAAEAHRSRGYALEKQGHYAAALEELTRAEAIARSHLDSIPPLLIAAIAADMGLVLLRQGKHEQALDVCTEGLSKVRVDRRSREDERIGARLHTQIGTIFGMRGDYAESRFHFENALAIQEQIDNLHGSSILHNNIGYLWQLQSDYERAVEHYVLAEELARKINAKYILSGTCLNTAYASYCLGRYDQAEAGCYAALALCEEMGEQDGIAKVYDLLGLIASNRGNYTQALDVFAKALALLREIGSSYQEVNTLANIATVYLAQDEVVQAQALAEQSAVIAGRLQAAKLQVDILKLLAEIDLTVLTTARSISAHDQAMILERAVERADHALALAEELGSKFDYGVARRLQGQIAAYHGYAFAEHFQASMAVFSEIKNPFELARTQACYAAILAGSNQNLAETYQKQALQTFIEIGARGEVARLSKY